jgi:ribonuclease R
MEEIGLDPYAVNNRGVVILDDDGTVVSEDVTLPSDLQV